MPNNPIGENSKLRGMNRRTAIHTTMSVVFGTSVLWFLSKFLRPHSMNAPRTVRIASVAELFTNNSVATLAVEGNQYAFHKTGQGITAVLLTCTHAGCPLQLTPKHIECVCHGGVFSYAGTPLSGPPKQPLRSLTAWLSGDDVYVRIPAHE